jgi:hypothetical protein
VGKAGYARKAVSYYYCVPRTVTRTSTLSVVNQLEEIKLPMMLSALEIAASSIGVISFPS